ncbi:MAG: hypothetical protein V1778_03210 [bacterium]
MNNLSRAAIFSLIVGFALLGASCSQKAAEKSTERAIEKATNGQVNVDVGTNSATIQTNAGTMQIGGSASIPSGFPSDVYVENGTVTSSVTTTENQGYTVSIETTASVSAVQANYTTHLQADGWTITYSGETQETVWLMATKEKRTVSVSITSQDGKTVIALSTATGQ